MENMNQNLIQNEPIRNLQIGSTDIIILGTAHISKESVKAVEELIYSLQPDTICVELCNSRLLSLKDPEFYKKLDIYQIIRQRKVYLLLSSLILSAYQKKLGEGHVPPGEEFRKAIQLGENLGCKIVPIDRDIQITLKRAWGSVGFFSKLLLISNLIASLFVREKIEPEKLEELKKEDILQELFSQLPPQYKNIQKVIIQERDEYMAQKIRDQALSSQSKKILAVVGAGHLTGIMKNIVENKNIEELETTPPKTIWEKIRSFLIPIIFAMFFVWGFYVGGTEVGKELLLSWIILKSSLAGIGAAIALAHPLSILLAMLAAPIGNFNPIIKPGWVAALAESWLRKPRAEDFENISKDSEKFSGYWKNRVIRIFFVLFLPQLGSSIGTFLVMKAAFQL